MTLAATVADWLHAAGIGPTAIAQDHHFVETVSRVATARGVRPTSLAGLDHDAVRTALRNLWGLPLLEPLTLCDAAAIADPFDPRHQEALAESSRHFRAQVTRLPRAAE